MHIDSLMQVTAPGLAYVCFGGFVVMFSLVSLLVREKLNINEVLLGTIFGVLAGPYVANIFNPRSWGPPEEKVTLEVTRVVLAIGLFIIGIDLPKNYICKHVKGLLVMVVPTMAIGWVLIAGFLTILFPRLETVSCLAISACLTPTDPIICAAIVGGKFAERYVPQTLRHLLSAESAANDGLAYPFLTIALYLTLESSTTAAFEKWFLIGCLYQVVLGIVLGSVLGVIFSSIMKWSMRKGLVNKESYLAQQLALGLFTMGVLSTIGSDDLLAAFAAGCAVSWNGDFNDHIRNEAFAPVVDFILNSGCFIYIGAWLPFKEFISESLEIEIWRLFILLIVVILLRRIPALLSLGPWIPEVRGWKQALFCGHFGPMGVSAVFVSSLALTKLPKPHDPPQSQPEVLAVMIQPIVAFVVLGSIIIHGLSVAVLSFPKVRTLIFEDSNEPQGLPVTRASNNHCGAPENLHGSVSKKQSHFEVPDSRANHESQGNIADEVE